MGASYNKSVLKSRAARGTKAGAGADADWVIGWSSPADREAAPEDSGAPPSAPARSASARSNAAKGPAHDANAKTAHD